MARSSRGSALGRSPWRRASRPSPHEAHYQAHGVLDRLGNPEPFFPEGLPSANVPSSAWHQASQARESTAGRMSLTEALVAPRPSRDATVCPNSRSPDDSHPGHSRLGRGRRSPAPAGRHPRWPWRAPGRAGRPRWPGHTSPMIVEIVGQKERDLSQPTRVVEGRGEGLGLAQAVRGCAQSPSGRAPCAGRAGDRWPARRVALLRQMREGAERLLEVPHGLAVGRPRHGLLPACRQYARALSHTSPRRAWWARRSTCSATRSPRRAPRGPRQCGRAAPAAAPAAGCRRPPRASGRA